MDKFSLMAHPQHPSPPPSFSSALPLHTRSSLPEECLALVFQHLSHDRSALHALLLVSRQFFRLVVPLLYRSPFRLLETKSEPWSWSERTRRQVLLLQLLLRSAHSKKTGRQRRRRGVPLLQSQRQSHRFPRHRQGEHDQQHSDSNDDDHHDESNSLGACSIARQSFTETGRREVDVSPPDHEDHTLQPSPQLGLTSAKRRQQWWSRRRASSSTSVSTSTSSLLSASPFSQLSPLVGFSMRSSLSKKESNVFDAATAVSPTKIQGRSPRPFLARLASAAANDPSSLQQHSPPGQQHHQHQQDRQQQQQQRQQPSALTQKPPDHDWDTYSHSSSFLRIPGAYEVQMQRNDHSVVARSSQSFPKRMDIDCSDSLSHDFCLSDDSSDDSLSDQDLRHHFRHSQVLRAGIADTEESNNNSGDDDDDDDDDDDADKNGVTLLGSFFSMGSSSLVPNLGPFSLDKEGSRNWTQTLQQRLGSISSATSENNGRPHVLNTRVKCLMADYLSHYIEQDHPKLARLLPFIFPQLPAESFVQLLTSTAPSTTHSAPDGSPTSRLPVLSIFQSLQQPQKGSQTADKAQSARVRVERYLLHHSPNRIRSLSLSASRINAVTSPPPQRRRYRNSCKLGLSSLIQNRQSVATFTALFSFLTTFPFSKTSSADTIANTVNTAPVSSSAPWHSSASSSTVFSSLSSQSTASSSSTDSSSSAETLVWSDLPHLSELYCLQRIELYDIHHKFDSVAIVDFLKLHDSAYHTIREIKIGGPDDLGRSTHSGVIQVLQALRTVKVLDMIEWREAIQFLDQIPTIHLEILLLGNVRMTAEEVTAQSNETQDDDEAEEKEQQHPQIQTLMRSRRLRELRMPVLIDGLFRWAVQERRQRLRHTMPHSSPCVSLTPSTSAKPSSPPPRWDYGPNPMPLEKVYLSGTSTGPLISTLIDVADAFRDSIRVLQSTSWMDSTETLSCCLSLSWTWHLPQLQVLDLQGEIAYRFRIQALQHCPLLRVLSLSLPHSVLTQSSVMSLADPAVESCPLCARSSSQTDNRDEFGNLLPLSLADLFDPRGYGDHNQRDSSLTSCAGSSQSSQQERHGGWRNESTAIATTLFPRLEELKLVGDWGLRNESLLGIAAMMPRLRRLSLLRCESEWLTAQGLMNALPHLRNEAGERESSGQGGVEGSPCCRIRQLEVSKSWQSELEAALTDRENHSALVDAVKMGISPLEIAYSY